MNARITLSSLLAAISIVVIISRTVAQKASESEREYTVPAELGPVWKWKSGYSAEETMGWESHTSGMRFSRTATS